MLDELGAILREAREAKGLTLADVQEKTRIGTKFLEALENAEYEQLPTAVHVRGYLRNYARFLSLDPKPLLERYELSQTSRAGSFVQPSKNHGAEQLPFQTAEDQPFFDPVNLDLSGRQRRGSGSLQRLVIIVALVVSLALIANRFIPMLAGRGDGTEALTDGINEAVNEILNGGQVDSEPTPAMAEIPGSGQTITSTNRNDALQLPTPTATRPVLPGTMDTVQLRLDITERSWMRVTIDGEVVFEGLARRGDEPYIWEAQQEAVFLTGNANGIFVTVNDVQLGRLGARGEVVEETWTSTRSQ